MTIISKAMEKRSDTMEEPLVDNMVTGNEEKKLDLETGGIPQPQTTRYIITTRVRPYYTLILALMIILLVATSLLGIFGTEALYEQYQTLVADEKAGSGSTYRGWTTIAYNDDVIESADDTGMAMGDGRWSPAQNDELVKDILNDVMNTQKEFMGNIQKAMMESAELAQSDSMIEEPSKKSEEMETTQPKKSELQQKFELDVKGKYEKISVKHAAKFVHDFEADKTAIVDKESGKCFVMPLDHKDVLPPTSLQDLLDKMKNSYYDVDTQKVQKEMRVALPAVEDTSTLGVYIDSECHDYTTYMLEKFVHGVFKRSIIAESSGQPGQYASFNGRHVTEYLISY